MSVRQLVPPSSPIGVCLAYIGIGATWIAGVSVVLAFGSESRPMPTLVELLPGLTFVGLSGILLYGLLRIHHQRMRLTRGRLETISQQLQVLHRVFRHNIRNELNVILGYTTVASENVRQTELEPETTPYLNRIEDTASDIVTISEKLKLIDVVGPKINDPTPVDVVELVDAEVTRIRTAHPRVTISTTAPDRSLVATESSIRFAIREVLENAVNHHNGPRNRCHISIEIDRGPDDVVLTIADNGPGVPQEELTALRTEAETQLVHASSVGLWLVTWLTEVQDGTVTFTTEPGVGTTVTFELPAPSHTHLLETEAKVRRTAKAFTG